MCTSIGLFCFYLLATSCQKVTLLALDLDAVHPPAAWLTPRLSSQMVTAENSYNMFKAQPRICVQNDLIVEVSTLLPSPTIYDLDSTPPHDFLNTFIRLGTAFDQETLTDGTSGKIA